MMLVMKEDDGDVGGDDGMEMMRLILMMVGVIVIAILFLMKRDCLIPFQPGMTAVGIKDERC